MITDPESGVEEARAYPMLPCVLEWEGRRTPQTEGLLDSGADSVVLPLEVAKYLGLMLKEGEESMKVVGREVPRYSAKVNLIIGRAGRYWTFPDVEVAIPMEGDTPIIIGRDPVFKVYKVTFDELSGRFILEPH